MLNGSHAALDRSPISCRVHPSTRQGQGALVVLQGAASKYRGAGRVRGSCQQGLQGVTPSTHPTLSSSDTGATLQASSGRSERPGLAFALWPSCWPSRCVAAISSSLAPPRPNRSRRTFLNDPPLASAGRTRASTSPATELGFWYSWRWQPWACQPRTRKQWR
jgi:hypothetical protein